MNLSSQICGMLYDFARTRNGETIEIELNGVPVLIVQSLEDAGHVLRHNAVNYRKNMAWFRQALGASRFSEDGEAWKVRQALTQRHFAQFDRDRTVLQAARYAHRACDAMLRDSAEGRQTIDDDILRNLTVSVLVECFFGVAPETISLDLGNLARLMDCGSEYSFVPAGHTGTLYRERLGQLPELRRQVLADLRPFRNGEVPSSPLLADMLAADRDPATGIVLEHELLTFFAAGAETSAATIGWACYLLARHPEVQEALRQEVRAYLAGGQRDWSVLSRIEPIANFISETLRLYPPTPIVARLARGPDRIGQHAVDTGQNVLVSFVGVQHDARIRPDPWRLDIDPRTATRPPAGTVTAFSFGPRVCGGKNFALVELASALCVLLERARFTLTSEESPSFHWKSQMLRQGGQPVRLEPLPRVGS